MFIQRMGKGWLLITVLVWAFIFTEYVGLFFFLDIRRPPPHTMAMLALMGTISLGMLTASITEWWRRK